MSVARLPLSPTCQQSRKVKHTRSGQFHGFALWPGSRKEKGTGQHLLPSSISSFHPSTGSFFTTSDANSLALLSAPCRTVSSSPPLVSFCIFLFLLRSSKSQGPVQPLLPSSFRLEHPSQAALRGHVLSACKPLGKSCFSRRPTTNELAAYRAARLEPSQLMKKNQQCYCNLSDQGHLDHIPCPLCPLARIFSDGSSLGRGPFVFRKGLTHGEHYRKRARHQLTEERAPAQPSWQSPRSICQSRCRI